MPLALWNRASLSRQRGLARRPSRGRRPAGRAPPPRGRPRLPEARARPREAVRLRGPPCRARAPAPASPGRGRGGGRLTSASAPGPGQPTQRLWRAGPSPGQPPGPAAGARRRRAGRPWHRRRVPARSRPPGASSTIGARRGPAPGPRASPPRWQCAGRPPALQRDAGQWSHGAWATSIPRQHGTSRIRTPVRPTLQIQAPWPQTTGRALGVQDVTTHAPLRSRGPRLNRSIMSRDRVMGMLPRHPLKIQGWRRSGAVLGSARSWVGNLLPAGVPSPHERPMTQDCAADNCSGPVRSACDVLAQSHRSSRGCFSEGRRQESPT